jgi:hypothetical protein
VHVWQHAVGRPYADAYVYTSAYGYTYTDAVEQYGIAGDVDLDGGGDGVHL